MRVAFVDFVAKNCGKTDERQEMMMTTTTRRRALNVGLKVLQCVTGPDGRAQSLTHKHTLPPSLSLSLSLWHCAFAHDQRPELSDVLSRTAGG